MALTETSAGATTQAGGPHRLPVVWVALALFVASLAGCIVTIVLALAQPDGTLPEVGERLLSVPAAHQEAPR